MGRPTNSFALGGELPLHIMPSQIHGAIPLHLVVGEVSGLAAGVDLFRSHRNDSITPLALGSKISDA